MITDGSGRHNIGDMLYFFLFSLVYTCREIKQGNCNSEASAGNIFTYRSRLVAKIFLGKDAKGSDAIAQRWPN